MKQANIEIKFNGLILHETRTNHDKLEVIN